jgi:hypothetical protein
MGISGSNDSFSRKFIQAFSFHPAGKQLNAGAVSKNIGGASQSPDD